MTEPPKLSKPDPPRTPTEASAMNPTRSTSSARSVAPFRRALAFGAIAIVALLGTLPAPSHADDAVDFSRDVLPILSENCLLCHGPDADARKADLRLDLKDSALRHDEPVIVPGKSAESELIFRVTSDDETEVMPPPGEKRHPLTAEEIATLTRWIDQGAPWGTHWAFKTPRRPPFPALKNDAWVKNGIDRFILAKLDAEALAPSPEADRTTLIRRASLDLTGIPPTVAEVDAFLADTSANAYETVVERLLASPRYGERMAVDWLDAARFADTNGFQNDFARTMWPWRDWVINAFNTNQPFDKFTIEQIAGDLLPNPTLSQKIATGFNRNNRTVTEAGSIEEEWRIENAIDRVETTATVFLGLTMGCARCHDHKYNPVTQEEFYSFLAFFSSVNEKGVYTETRGNVPPLVSVPSPEDARNLKRLDDAVAAAEQRARDLESAVAAEQNAWEQRQQAGPPPAEPTDWALRVPLDGNLHVDISNKASIDAALSGGTPPSWSEGPSAEALKLPGNLETFVQLDSCPDLDRGDRFSYGGWFKTNADGAILSKMDDASGFRGFDLLATGGRLQVHIVSHWPDDALKVITHDPVPKDSWHHVFVVYDGSGKASGVAVYLDGRALPLDVEADTLKGPITNAQPLRLGKRSTSLPLNGQLADIRIYSRALSAEEVARIAARPMLDLARAPAEGRSKPRQDMLARFYAEHYAVDLRAARDAVASLHKERDAAQAKIPTVMVMEDMATPRETFVLKRGQYDMPDPSRKVSPGVPACMPDMPEHAPANRLGLARWLVDPENPLTSRVFVNRIWQQHFGVGLVKTTENFGLQGEPPSHPELLDWLATEFIAGGWDMKALHRLIVTSATYRQSSRADEQSIARDPENRLLARGPRFRLPAEAVRDNALAISGLLVAKLGGPSIKPYQPAGLWEELAGGAGEGPYVRDKGDGLYRRSLYVYRKRTVPHPVMATFDGSSRETCQVKYAKTNTPLQALELLNDVTYVEAARHLAQLMLTEGGLTPAERVNYAFRRAVARPPTDAESAVLVRALARYRQDFDSLDAAEKLIRHGDSPVPPGLDPRDLAAYTTAASVILNLDETMTQE